MFGLSKTWLQEHRETDEDCGDDKGAGELPQTHTARAAAATSSQAR